LPAGARIESIVDDRFAGLRQLVGAPDDKAAAPIDATVALINEVYVLLNAADIAVKGGNAPPPSDVPNKVKAEAARLPEPVRSLLATLSVSGTKAAQDIANKTMGSVINAEIGDFCRQATSGRYPFVRSSSRDVTQEDFARLFAPGGLFDAFFQKNLAAQVDMSTRPWSYKRVDGVAVGGDGATLAQFQRAAIIRDTFFRGGGNVPGLRLEFKTAEMDASITQFILDVDGQILKYAHGPQIQTTLQWPGPRGSARVSVALSPVSASGSSGLVKEGPWALFRLFDSQQLEESALPEKFRVSFNVDARKAVFDVTASSVRNPFRLPELAEFSCPGRQ
jgi:type VI secretion system protein ImpL